MPLTLQNQPGFADISDTTLAAESPALADDLRKISLNAAFGMCRPEVFTGLYKHGESVLLPVSAIDGYVYQRSELMYLWSTQSTLNPDSGWITGPDSLWYAAWIVDQTNGNVESIEYYRRSGSHANPQQSNDGTLRVYTIAQRLKTALVVNFPATFWSDIADSSFVTDAALTQLMAQTMGRDSKFAVLNSEAVYMGEFVTGQTIPRPVSPADGYQYAYSQVRFGFSWRWTTTGSAFTQPDLTPGQLGPMKASINASTGAVSLSVAMIDDAGNLFTYTGNGRIAVVAFCSRESLMSGLAAIANGFAEIDLDVFSPGVALRASTMLQLMKNLREAACSCEYFGPTTYHDGDTVPVPISSKDSYVYSRNEITPVWEWSDTTNETGSHLRVAAFWGDVSQTTGHVTLRNWRLPPGGPYVESDSFSAINVIVVAQRGAQHSTLVSDGANPAGDSGSAVVDNNQPDNSPYAIPYYAGETNTPGANEQILKHVIPGDVATVLLPVSLTGSYGGCVIAPTGAVSFTLKKGTTTIGSLNIAAAATTMTFSFTGAITLVPGDIVNVIAPATPDATLKGVYFTLSGTRT